MWKCLLKIVSYIRIASVPLSKVRIDVKVLELSLLGLAGRNGIKNKFSTQKARATRACHLAGHKLLF